MGGPFFTAMAQYMKLTFPVGYASKEDVETCLGRARKQQRWSRRETALRD